MPMTVWLSILELFLEMEVHFKLVDHTCDALSPCSILKKALQQCLELQLVCQTWRSFVIRFLQDERYSKLRKPSPSTIQAWAYGSSVAVAYKCSLGGRYKAFEAIQDEYEKCIVVAHDYGSSKGCCNKSQVIIKVSSYKAQYENEKDVYSWPLYMPSADLDIPRLHFAGEYGMNSGYYALVLDQLGPDLDKLRRNSRRERFTPHQTLAVAIQTIQVYQRLHMHGWLHCNAKPGNFAIGPDTPGQRNRVLAFDFEHSQRIEPTPRIKKTEDCFGWNCLFKPTTWEMHMTPSHRDDMEGLGYVFSYLERGSLPWEHNPPEEMWRVKMCIPASKLFEGMDPIYTKYFNYVKALAWGEVPDYAWIEKLFRNAWTRRGFKGIPEDIDWWKEFRLRT